MVIGMAEFLSQVAKLKTRQEKIDALKANDSKELRTILQGAFDPNVKWLIPEGVPPYTPNVLVDQEHVLLKEIRRDKLLYFIEGFFPNLKSQKREMMFIEMLENIDKKDAELLISIKDKKFPYKGITVDMVTEALEGIF